MYFKRVFSFFTFLVKANYTSVKKKTFCTIFFYFAFTFSIINFLILLTLNRHLLLISTPLANYFVYNHNCTFARHI